MKKRGLDKVGLLSENSAFGQSGRRRPRRVAGKHRMTAIVADETYGPDADVTTQLTKINGTAGVQTILVFGLGQGPAVVTKNYGQLGLTLPLYQSHGVASEEYIRLSGKAAEGVRLPASALLVASVLPDSDPQKPVVTSYVKAYTGRYKSEVSTFGGHAYDGLMLAVEAIKRAGSTDKAKVRDALEKTKGFIGTSGVVNFSPTDHLGLDLSAFRMLEIRNGTWTLLSSQVLALRTDPPAVPTTAEQRKAYCGRYTLGDLTYVVRCEPDGLTGGSPGKPSKPLRVETPDVLFVPGEPRLRYLFQRDASGRVIGFLQRRESWDLAWKRVD
jgi:hypothetical protein